MRLAKLKITVPNDSPNLKHLMHSEDAYNSHQTFYSVCLPGFLALKDKSTGVNGKTGCSLYTLDYMTPFPLIFACDLLLNSQP